MFGPSFVSDSGRFLESATPRHCGDVIKRGRNCGRVRNTSARGATNGLIRAAMMKRGMESSTNQAIDAMLLWPEVCRGHRTCIVVEVASERSGRILASTSQCRVRDDQPTTYWSHTSLYMNLHLVEILDVLACMACSVEKAKRREHFSHDGLTLCEATAYERMKSSASRGQLESTVKNMIMKGTLDFRATPLSFHF